MKPTVLGDKSWSQALKHHDIPRYFSLEGLVLTSRTRVTLCQVDTRNPYPSMYVSILTTLKKTALGRNRHRTSKRAHNPIINTPARFQTVNLISTNRTWRFYAPECIFIRFDLILPHPISSTPFHSLPFNSIPSPSPPPPLHPHCSLPPPPKTRS